MRLSNRDHLWLRGATLVFDQRAAVCKHTAIKVSAKCRRRAGDCVEAVGVFVQSATWDATQQTNRVWVTRIREDIFSGTLLYKCAGVQHANSVAHVANNAEVVTDKENRSAGLFAQLAHQVEHFSFNCGIKACGWLVHY